MKLFIFATLLAGLSALRSLGSSRSILQQTMLRSTSPTVVGAPVKKPKLGGKIVVTGIGETDEDEFMLNLLNEQSIWDNVVLAVKEPAPVQKRFLSRTARYSGLLNILEVASADVSNSTSIGEVLKGANAWIAFNVSQSAIPQLATDALNAGVLHSIMTMQLPSERFNETVIPEFDIAQKMFQESDIGASFLGIRHGKIVEGSEDNPYEISNSTTECLEDTVERGVLARVTAELLCVDEATNTQCGVSSSRAFASAYLNILRSSGLSRRQEVRKMFQGGLQRVARLTLDEYKARAERRKEAQEKAERAKLEREADAERERVAAAKAALAPLPGEVVGDDDEDSITPGWDREAEFTGPTDEERIQKRTLEILQNVWREYDTRMYTKSTPKSDFFDANRETARMLAVEELAETKKAELKKMEEKEAQRLLVDRVMDVNRKQYSKLLALEKKEMQNQKQISDIWVKYVYLLLEVTMTHCKEQGILFHNMDEFQQTLLLRSKANELRKMCNLPAFDVVYDPLDASVIVGALSTQSIGVELGLQSPADELVPLLNSKYGESLKKVSALRGASQIIELAIETLNKELPSPPPTVRELKQAESAGKQAEVSRLNLESIKNRGKPFQEGPSVVGKM